MRGGGARASALRVLRGVEVRGVFADDLLRAELARLSDEAERALATELAYGVLRWRKRLDWIIESQSATPVERMTPWIRNILRMGVYQLCFLDRVPDHAAVDEGVKLARRYGHEGTARLVNAVLRSVARAGRELSLPEGLDTLDRMAVEYSHPRWIVARWVSRYGMERAREILAADNRVPPITIRVNRPAVERDELFSRLERDGLKVSACEYAPEGLRLGHHHVAVWELPGFRDGFFQMQDEGSMLVGHLAGARPGMRVLDCCAGAGIKAGHLAAVMGNVGEIVALDVRAQKVRELRENCRRLGVSIVRSMVADATQPLPVKGVFDVVTVDAPCSDLGVLRRHPEARWRDLEGRLPELARLQAAILLNAAHYVAEGGALVYSTCSTEPEENEAVVGVLIKDDAPFAIEDAGLFLPEPARRFVDASGCLRTLPGDGDMDGFFAVKLRRARG